MTRDEARAALERGELVQDPKFPDLSYRFNKETRMMEVRHFMPSRLSLDHYVALFPETEDLND